MFPYTQLQARLRKRHKSASSLVEEGGAVKMGRAAGFLSQKSVSMSCAVIPSRRDWMQSSAAILRPLIGLRGWVIHTWFPMVGETHSV